MKKLYFLFILLFFTSLISNAQIEDPKIEETSNKSKAKIVVHTKTGEIYKGYFISQNKDFLEIETESVGILKIPTQRIKTISTLDDNQENDSEAEERLKQVNAVRYMVGTSAFNYEKGGDYLRNNPMTYHRGVTDNFSIGVGTSLWALVLRVPIIYVNPQFTTQLGRNVRYKIGLDAFAGTSFEEGGAAAAFINTGITIGEPDLNITGTVYWGALSDFERLDPFYSLAGMARISKKLMIVSEGFYVPLQNDNNEIIIFMVGDI